MFQIQSTNMLYLLQLRHIFINLSIFSNKKFRFLNLKITNFILLQYILNIIHTFNIKYTPKNCTQKGSKVLETSKI